MKRLAIIALAFCGFSASSQTNITFSNATIPAVLAGSYNPADYAASTIIDDPNAIATDIINEVNVDTIEYYSDKLVGFETRHVWSDTVSNTRGIGAARRWIVSRFNAYDAANENRLEVGYLNFDFNAASVCPSINMQRNRNCVAVLPGTDPSKPFILIEAHMDSRCSNVCDTSCLAPGRDDNGSGTVMVMELARVMSKYTFERTIVFTTTTGEELGLLGGEAWANYIDQNNLNFMACYNNDIVGGILCGPVASPPACSTPGALDSTSVRIFSFSSLNNAFVNSEHKQMARYIRLQQEEVINPQQNIDMLIRVMLETDRQGRGGDHQPFVSNGLRSVRFTSNHEHGDGSGGAGHLQHTSNDTLINFPYLQRNTRTNGVNMTLMAFAPPSPTPTFTPVPNGLKIEMTGADANYLHYRVGVRNHNASELYWDTVYTFTGQTTFVIGGLVDGDKHYVSVMNVNSDDVESLPSDEYTLIVSDVADEYNKPQLYMSQNRPNPFNDATRVTVELTAPTKGDIQLRVSDMLGRTVRSYPVYNTVGTQEIVIRNEEWYDGNFHMSGIFLYSLTVDGVPVATRKMIIE